MTQLTLPEHPNKKKRRNFSVGIVLVVVLQIITIVSVFLRENNAQIDINVDYLQKTALKLEEMNMRSAAVEVWREYLTSVDLAKEKLSAIHLRIARLLQQEGRNSDSIRHFVLAQKLETRGEQQRKITEYLSESLQAVGRINALEGVLKEQVDAGYKKEVAEPVARIGRIDISADDLEQMIHKEMTTKLNLMMVAFPEMSLRKSSLKQEINQQYSTPEGKKRALEEYLFTEALWRKSIEDELHISSTHQKNIRAVAKKMLANEVLQREMGRQVVVLPQEIEAFYATNSQMFVTPATAEISLKASGEGEQITQEATTVTITPQTKEVEGFGDISTIVKDVFSANVKDLYSLNEQKVAVVVVSKTSQSIKKIEEVRDQVQQIVYQKKYQMLLQQFIGELYSKYKIEIFASDNDVQEQKREKK